MEELIRKPIKKTKEAPKREEVIILDHVSKSFKAYSDRAVTLKEKALFRKRRQHKVNPILKDINISIKKGEVVGLIGKNGCGKSTTLKLMTRILYPEQGTVTVKGRVSSLLELGAGFHPDLTGIENIYANAAIFGLKKKEIDRKLNEIVAFSELGDYINSPVRTYSSGMYMRLAFSVAINVNADVLLIDEILAVGDLNFQTKCYRRMNQLKDSGITIVLVTHDTGTVETFCNRAIWLNNGEIMADGNQMEVVDQYRRYMNEAQIEKMREDETEEKPKEEQEEEQQEQDEEENANHFGTKDVVITDAYMMDAEGRKTQILRGGERAEICIRYKVNKPCRGYMFGMGIFTMDNIMVYGNNTDHDGIRIEEMPGEGMVRYKIDELPLLSGEYKLNVAIVDHNQEPLDFYRCYMCFTVASMVRAVGIVDIKHRWEIPTLQEENR